MVAPPSSLPVITLGSPVIFSGLAWLTQKLSRVFIVEIFLRWIIKRIDVVHSLAGSLGELSILEYWKTMIKEHCRYYSNHVHS